MKAWHVQDTEGDRQEIVFADTRGQAISKSEAIEWTEYINIRARRAKYADDLENDPSKLIQAQINNDWLFECHGNCINNVTKNDNYKIIGDSIYCGKCSTLRII